MRLRINRSFQFNLLLISAIKFAFCGIVYFIVKARSLLTSESKYPKIENSKILVISNIGLGNAILSIPLIAKLKINSPRADVDILTINRAAKSIYEGVGLGRDIMLLTGNIFKSIKLVIKLYKFRYDFCFITFPTLSLPMEILPLLIGARCNVSHDYSSLHPFFKYIKGLYEKLVSVEIDIHDIEQNLNLIKPLNIQIDNFSEYPPYKISADSYKFAERFLIENKISKDDIKFCIHAGSKKSAHNKRWPLENYLSLAGLLKSRFGAQPVFVLGPDEEDLQIEIARHRFLILQSNELDQIIAVIKQCSFIVSNDSGIMHAASLTNIPIFAIWGATDENRNGARGANINNITSEEVTCRPCIRIIPEVKCECQDYACLSTITVEKVYAIIVEKMKMKQMVTES